MFNKTIFLILIASLGLYLNDYLIEQPLFRHVLSLISVLFLYYGHGKLISFCKGRMKEVEDSKESNNILQFPVWKNVSNTPFLEACKRGNTSLVTKMLKEGADKYETNENGEGPIYLAVYNLISNLKQKNATCIWILHHIGCNMNEKNNDGFTPLHLAAAHGHLSLIKWMINRGADIKIQPSAAGIALFNGYEKTAAYLLAIENQVPIYRNIRKIFKK